MRKFKCVGFYAQTRELNGTKPKTQCNDHIPSKHNFSFNKTLAASEKWN
jgi:hypothetical protein